MLEGYYVTTQCTVIPAMVQRLRFFINVQHLSHRFAFQRSLAVPAHKIAFQGNVLHIYGRVAPLRELLYTLARRAANVYISS